MKFKNMNGKITMGTKANEFIYNKAKKNWKIKCFNKINNENIIYECKKVICSAPLRDVIKNKFASLV